MKIIIHKGTKEIGGTCIQIQGREKSILLDLGKPLSPTSKPINIDKIKVDAVLISHAHLDHYGLIYRLPKHTPVYMGKLSQNIINAVAIFTGNNCVNNPIVHFDKNSPFFIDNFKITPFLVDHSIVDAYAFLIEDESRAIVYSGDFRSHGYKAKIMQSIAKKIKRPIDLLLMEGTCIERPETVFKNESDVFKKIKNTISDQETASFLISSSTNVDRLKSAHMACCDTGKLLAIDIYTAYILECMRSVSSKLPKVNDKHVRIISKKMFAKSYYCKIKDNPKFKSFIKKIYNPDNAVSVDEILLTPEKYLIKVAPSHAIKIISKLPSNKRPAIIYSMWKGYEQYQDFQQNKNIDLIYAHTSGHASVEELMIFLKNIKPHKLAPVHTENPDLFKKVFRNECSVIMPNDNEEVLI